MNLHLQTLALTLITVSGLFLLTFAYLGVRYSWSTGARWWAMVALATMGMVVLLYDPSAYGTPAYYGGFVLLSYCCFLHWVGLRAHLGLPWRWSHVALASALAWTPSFWVVLVRPQADLAVLLGGLCAIVVWCSSNIAIDIRRHGDELREPELRWLRWQSWAEVLATLLVLVGMLARTPTPSDVSWFTILVPLYILPTASRLGMYFLLYVRDLETGRLRDRQALRASQLELHSLVHNLGAGVLVLDERHRLQMANRAAQRFFAPLSPLVDGLPLPWNQWQVVDTDGHTLDMAQGLPAGNWSDVVWGIGLPGKPERERVWALVNSFDVGAATPRRVLTLVDITALRRAQQEQRQLQISLAEGQRVRALGTLAGGVAHDFNNILTAILGNAQVMQRTLQRQAAGPVSDDWLQEQRESADAMAAAARRGRELVRQILSYGRRSPMQWQRCRVADVVQEVLRLLRMQLPVAARLRVDVPADLPDVWGDPTQLTQALLNLGTNAAHALPDGQGLIEFVARRVQRSDASLPAEWVGGLQPGVQHVVCIEVSDTGVGMLPETLERMYEPFFTTKPQGLGTGLGLPVVQGVVHAHGGAIDAVSRPGQGSRFSLYFLPAAAEVVPAATVALATPPTLSVRPFVAHRILLVEDDVAAARAAQRVLQQAGHRCEVQHDPLQALQTLQGEAEPPDVVVLDQRMAGMDGFALAQRLRERYPDLPMVMMSAHIERDFHERAQAVGLRGVWLKSDCVESLDEWVEQALSAPAALGER